MTPWTRGDQHRPNAGGRQTVKRLHLLAPQIQPAEADGGLRLKPVKLEVDDRLDGSQGVDELLVLGQPKAVGVEHHLRDPAGVGGSQDGADLLMNGRLAAADLEHLEARLLRQQAVQHEVHLVEAERRSWHLPGAGEARRAAKVAGLGDFHDRQAGVLRVLRTEAAVVRAAAGGGQGRRGRWRGGKVEAEGPHIPVRVRRQQRHLRSVARAGAVEEHAAVARHHAGGQDRATVRAERLCV